MQFFQENTNNEEANTEEYTTSQPPRKRSKPDEKLQMLKEAFGILKSSAQKSEFTPPPPQENPELRSFCDFIFQKLKYLDQHAINVVQQDILQVIFRVNQGYYGSAQQYGNLSQPTFYQQTYNSSRSNDTTENHSLHHRSTIPPITELHLGRSVQNYSSYQQGASTSSLSITSSPLGSPSVRTVSSASHSDTHESPGLLTYVAPFTHSDTTSTQQYTHQEGNSQTYPQETPVSSPFGSPSSDDADIQGLI